MRLSIWLTAGAALLMAAVVLFVGGVLLQPDKPLIAGASFSLDAITPNADGEDDITEFTYEITRGALVSLIFEHQDDDSVFYFRQDERRPAGQYQVFFSGVVDGYLLSGETVAGEVQRRLIPNGVYQWRLRAVAQDDREISEVSGTLTIADAEVQLPEILEFTVGPEVFTPNQDGVNDRTMINVYLTKEAALTVFLVNENEERLFIARREEGRAEGEAGRHTFDYEGGVDIGADPPPDGAYTVVVVAQDDVGQVVQRTASLTIAQGGKPRAEIVGQATGADVIFTTGPYDERYRSANDSLGTLVDVPVDPESLNITAVTLPVGDLLIFKLTVYNYGLAPIRTSGPPPGTVYEQRQISSSLGFYDQSGVWRVGIQCETSAESYPWRWAIGTEDDLYTEVDPANGNIYYYLAPGARSVVWGAIRMTELVETRNPQDCWAGLIHEDVEVVNSNVGRREIELADLSSRLDD